MEKVDTTPVSPDLSSENQDYYEDEMEDEGLFAEEDEDGDYEDDDENDDEDEDEDGERRRRRKGNQEEDEDDDVGVKIDTSRVQQKFSSTSTESEKDESCTVCGHHVYQMEKVKAEKRLYHRTCFRCKECNKQLNVDSYNSHEGELYCLVHFKNLFKPKAKFDEEDGAPRRQRKNEMIIRENIPQELPPEVVRYNSKLDDGLDNYQLDLTNIRQRFESGSEDNKPNQFSLSDTNALQRSESLLVRLQRYQSAITGERRRMSSEENNGHTSSHESSDDEGGHHQSHHHHHHQNGNEEDGGVYRETMNKKEKVPFTGLSSLKSQWESGTVASSAGGDGAGGDGEEGDGNEVSREEDKKEQLYRLRQRICLGRSASMRQVYEQALNERNGPNSSSSKSARSNSFAIESNIKAVSLKERFERGEIENETLEEERLLKIRKEKEEDLSVVTEAETAAREAKNIFKQMDEASINNSKSGISPVPGSGSFINGHNYGYKNSYHSLDRKTNSMSSSTSSTTTAAAVTTGEVIKCSDPSEKEEVVVETTQVQERFKFFECFKQPEAEPKRFAITPPPSERNGNSHRVSNDDEDDDDDATDGGHSEANGFHHLEGLEAGDLQRKKMAFLNGTQKSLDQESLKANEYKEEVPKTDIAKKMLNKFKQMESQLLANNNNSQKLVENPGPKPLKRITPPREYTTDTGDDQDEKDSTPERDPNIVRSSYKSEDVIPVEPEKARSLKEKFENWSVEVERENKRNFNLNEEEFPPKLDITKNLRAKFEAIKDENGKTIEKPKPRVNRFVNELGGVPMSDVCNICGTRLYPMEKLEFSGMKMHKNCFKCSHCMSSLRLDNYTLSAQKLYCLAHFKQLFMSKGNYDEGFGREQHKEKWFNKNSSSSRRNGNGLTNADLNEEDIDEHQSMENMEPLRDDNENELIFGKVQV